MTELIRLIVPDEHSLQELYSSLPVCGGDDPSIRLLDLRGPQRSATHHHTPVSSHNLPQLSGTLRVVSLASHPEYTALSYEWGGEPDTKYILNCNGAPIALTKNCYQALTSLSKQFGDLTIWVDAVCINQAAESEKDGQISLMGELYTWAGTTYIWLGNGTPESHQACKILNKPGRHYYFGAFGARAYRTRLAMLADFFIVHPFEVCTGWTAIYLSLLWDGNSGNWDHSHAAPEVSANLELLLQSSWIRRLWTFQELMLSSNPLLIRGESYLPWVRVTGHLVVTGNRAQRSAALAQWNKLAKTWALVARPLFWRGRQMRCSNIWNALMHCSYWTGICTTTSFHYHQPTQRTLMRFLSNLTFPLIMGSSSLSFMLITLMYGPHPFRDLFKVLWSILVIIIVPLAILSYSVSMDEHADEDVSTATLYTVRFNEGKLPHDRYFAVQGVLESLGLSVISVSSTHALADVYRNFFSCLLEWRSLNILLDAGSPQFPDRPSWIPRFDLSSQKQWIDPTFLDNPVMFPIDPDGFTAKITGSQLRSLAAFVDVVIRTTGVEQIESAMDESEAEQQNLKNLSTLLRFVLQVRRNMEAVPGANSLSQRMMETFYARPLGRIQQDEASRFRIWYGVLVRYCQRHMKDQHVQRCYNAIQNDAKSRDTHELICRSLAGQRVCIQTSQGRVGCASIFVRPGDRIVVVPTVAMPLLLRKANDNTWQLIGPAFVCGMMDGERRDNDVLQNIVVV